MIRLAISQVIFALGGCAVWACLPVASIAAGSAALPPSVAAPDAIASALDDRRLTELGAGDQIMLDVYGQPDMSSSLYVGNDGTISVPLAGAVQVSGLTPVVAAQRVERALIDKQILVAPHVTITILVSRSQRVSVLGEVSKPGQYVITPHTSIFDLLAEAGGTTKDAAEVIDVSRPDANGNIEHHSIDLKAPENQNTPESAQNLQSGDVINVPLAQSFYIYGEVAMPNKYPIGSSMTVIEAIARAGGITPRGSERHVEIMRMGKDGRYTTRHANLSDRVEPNDVIRVKESIF